MRVLKVITATMLVLTFCAAAHASIRMRVIAVNPSETEFKTTEVKIYLPDEVTPGDIIDEGGLEIEYDEKKSIYYMYEKEVELSPRQTKVFEVVIKDIWKIPDTDLDLLSRRTNRILSRLQESNYYAEAAQMADTIYERLEEISTSQNDNTVSRERHIGVYRTNLKVMERVKEDIDRLEKLLTYVGGPPAPEMLEDSVLKSDAPTNSTTWFIILLIIGFMGLLGMVFFLTWHQQAKMTEDIMLNARKTSFPGENETEEFKEELPHSEEGGGE
ncbi:MAG: hypothetical protein ABIG55_05620 [Candidatus Omnitrophota bacterium]